MKSCIMKSLLFCGWLALCLPNAALAQWLPDGTPICRASNDQSLPRIVSDGEGGGIVTWEDGRSTQSNIYAQRIDSSGAVLWATNGVGVCVASGNQRAPRAVSDGTGGAIIVWTDERTSSAPDLYVQRIDNLGNSVWQTDGVVISESPTSNKITPCIVPDGVGGAIIAWRDTRSGEADIYAQRVDPSGNMLWIAGGVEICAAANNQIDPVIAIDGAGGAIISWHDDRSADTNIFAQRVNGAGAVQWTIDGRAVCIASGTQRVPKIISDEAGGAIITWWDARSDPSYDIYAQRVDGSGNANWTADGVPVCTATGSQISPRIVPAAASGAIIVWRDRRSGNNNDIFAQRVDSQGNALWLSDGIAVTAASGDQLAASVAIDGSGGAIVAWEDGRTGSFKDVYVQRVNSDGNVVWETDGVAISTAFDNQGSTAIVSDMSGGAIVTWTDHRSGRDDIYAYRVPGEAPPQCAIAPTHLDFGTVAVGESKDTTFTIENTGGGSVSGLVFEVSPQYHIVSGEGFYELQPGESHVVTVRFEPSVDGLHNGAIETGDAICSDVSCEGVGGIPTGIGTARSVALALGQNYPNPFNPRTTIPYTVPEEDFVRITVLDSKGHLIKTLLSAEMPAGAHSVSWSGNDSNGSQVSSGVYFVRLQSAKQALSRKIILLK